MMGNFDRYRAHGTELYVYLSRMRGGPTGVNVSPDKQFPELYEHPSDYHIQYARWLLGGPLPLPPGYSGLIPDIPRPSFQLRVLNLPIQGEPLTPRPPSPGNASSPGTVPVSPRTLSYFSLKNIFYAQGTAPPSLQKSLLNTPFFPEKSSAPQGEFPASVKQSSELMLPGLTQTLTQTSTPASTPASPQSRMVTVPPGTDPKETAYLGQGAMIVFNISRSPTHMADFVPPLVTLYDTTGIEPFTDAHLNRPEGDPERADPALLEIPFPAHPNPQGQPALLTVPAESLLDNIDNQPVMSCMELSEGDICNHPTYDFCEDLTHDGEAPSAVCNDCNNSSRARFEPAVVEIVMAMRVYACGPCSRAALEPNNYEGKGFRVWGFPRNAFNAHKGDTKSTSMGGPLRLTGCSCATKLLDRRLCTAHRLHHFLEMREKARSMRDFINATFGRPACPFCLDRVGNDSYGFADESGAPAPVVYACMSCYGIVLL
ncbi:hypothetical protein F5Y07DRAFT_367515 [Xylaria sp. FL0933]|nr:hypothetical protein F5Y07DRAFT_367515 [Xylaria sp. FL0933]